MCWSPTADLLAGSAIVAVGVVSVASTRRPRDLPMAALPLVLGAHQLIEALVWRNADAQGDHAVGGTAVLLWMVIAYPLIPAWLPLAVFCAAGRWSRVRLAPFVTLGFATSAMLAYALATAPVTAEPVGHTMRYGVDVPLDTLAVAGYLVATIGSLLASDQQELRVLGLVTAAGAVVCSMLWQTVFVSTWCAFAAVASAIVLHWVRRPGMRRPGPDALRRRRVPAPWP
jgi:hypothetical protein